MGEPGEWKPSTGLGAIALGLFVTLVVGLTDQGRGAYREPQWYGWIFGAVACGTLAAVHLGAAAVRAYLGFVSWQDSRQPPVEPPAPDDYPPDEPDDAPDYLPAWRAAAHRFVTAGNLYGFKVRDIAAGDHKVIEWEDWGTMRDFLIEAGVLSPKGGTHWEDGWSWAHWLANYQTMPLPPASVKPPEVKLTVNKAQSQRQQQAEGV